jgi:hypothetical protein
VKPDGGRDLLDPRNIRDNRRNHVKPEARDMSIDSWRTVLQRTYAEAFDSLAKVLAECPGELWTASVWVVRDGDRHAWPIVRGMGADLPDAERLQLHSAFCNVAYHVLFFADWYLGGGAGQYDPPAPFRADEQYPHVLPHRVYSRGELLAYVDYCRRKAETVLGALTDESADAPARNNWPFAHTLVRNLVQITDHVSQLTLFLNLRAGWQDSRWTTSDRWFRKCEHCP